VLITLDISHIFPEVDLNLDHTQPTNDFKQQHLLDMMKVPGMHWLMPNVSLFANQDKLDHSSSNTTNLSSSSAHSSSSVTAAAAYNSSITLPSNNTNAATAVAAADNHPTTSNPSSTEGTNKMAYTSPTLAEVQEREVSSHQNPKPPQQKEDDYSSSSDSACEQSSESESEEESGAKKQEEIAAFNSRGGAKVKMGSGRGLDRMVAVMPGLRGDVLGQDSQSVEDADGSDLSDNNYDSVIGHLST
jgi:hypothetical protein